MDFIRFCLLLLLTLMCILLAKLLDVFFFFLLCCGVFLFFFWGGGRGGGRGAGLGWLVGWFCLYVLGFFPLLISHFFTVYNRPYLLQCSVLGSSSFSAFRVAKVALKHLSRVREDLFFSPAVRFICLHAETWYC